MKKKIAIITGASKGIGKAAALFFSKLEYHVILISRNYSALKILQQEIENLGGTASFFALDVSKANDVKKCIEDIIAKYAQIDILFNNAGIAFSGTSEIGDTEIAEMININLLGAIYVANNVAKVMKGQSSGYIFNLASIGGKISRPTMGGYNASKFGLVGYSEALFKEMLQYGVKVTAICPGITNTNMAGNVMQGTRLTIENLIPLDDIIRSIEYLLGLSNNTAINELIINCSTMLKIEENAKSKSLKV